MVFTLNNDFGNVIGVVPMLLYSIGQLMSPHTPRWRPDQESLFNIRLRKREPMGCSALPPDEPAVMGLPTLYLALWLLMSLPFPSPILANAGPSLYAALSLLLLVYVFQPHKRTGLAWFFGYWMFVLVITPVLVTLFKAAFSRLSSSVEPPQFSVIKLLLGWPSPIWANLPGIAQLQVLLTLLGGLYLTFRSIDGPQALNGTIGGDGTMWITFETDLESSAADKVLDVFRPNTMSTHDQALIKENANQLSQNQHVGYYGPCSYESTMPGLVLVVIGLITLFSSNTPVGENQALHASVPVSIVVGAVAVRISCMERGTPESLRIVLGWAGLLDILYGVALGNRLNNFSGAI